MMYDPRERPGASALRSLAAKNAVFINHFPKNLPNNQARHIVCRSGRQVNSRQLLS